MICAMAASYDSAEILESEIGIRLPFDLETCTLNNAAWNNWLAFDPLNSIQQNTTSLKSLDLCYWLR